MNLYPIHNETRLLQDLADSNVQAFETIYRAYSPQLYTNILKMVKQASVAQELLQDVFVKLWQKRATITIATSLSAYLYRMSANRVADYFTTIAGNKTILQEITEIAGSSYNPVEEALALKETNQLLNDAIEALPPKRREVFALCKLEGKTYAEAGQILGISAHTVHSQVGKAIKAIEEKLLGKGT